MFVATATYLTEDKMFYLLTITKPRVLELNLAKRVGSSMSRPCSLMKPWRCRKSSWRINDSHHPNTQRDRDRHRQTDRRSQTQTDCLREITSNKVRLRVTCSTQMLEWAMVTLLS